MAKLSSMAEKAPPGLAGLIERAADDRNAGADGLPPVDKWNPEHCGEIDMEIRADGSWYYMGTPIGRARLVRLFSTVLRKDEDGVTYLVTPVERIAIRVVDAHFVAVEMTRSEEAGQPVLTFRTNVGDVVRADAEHPLRFVVTGKDDQLKPYIRVRGRLDALISRAVTHELMGLGEEVEIDGRMMFAIRSCGEVFPVMDMAAVQDTADR
ncbi:DUF1285 domain-containing protein [Pseudohoeflea coraliihabitans]|uniref:DUF1285 domain-containing protein n=1 Tax=Pseudohoeflea coraliihabitans TaxID=2860393 RepID=A0ABS6WK29_9HYPH|nr:DUF1285 domain-containing protein [Pseudohoeflea sp. DP4N28-3]MBW3096125.1 DUF1285 domain-containing protein [Pseudohoeflea sp. DP4N28-3]